MLKHLLIVYHSQSGGTRVLVEAALKGALTEPGVDTRLIPAMEAGVNDLLWADALLFATPENFGSLSGGLKDFFDRTYYPVQEQSLNLPYGVIISAGNDGSGALRQLETIAKGYPLRCVAEPIIIRGLPSAAAMGQCQDLGTALAAGLAMGIY